MLRKLHPKTEIEDQVQDFSRTISKSSGGPYYPTTTSLSVCIFFFFGGGGGGKDVCGV